jgi:hypothetical protein
MSTEISIQEPDIVEISISQNYVTVSPSETAIDVVVNSVDPTVVTISNDQGPQGATGATGSQGDKGNTGDLGVVTSAIAPSNHDQLWADTSTTNAQVAVFDGGTPTAQLTSIKTRRGTASAWTSVNPVLDAGEFGYESDTTKFKIGDGSTAWNSLSYTTAVVSTIPASGLTGTTLASNVVSSSLTSFGSSPTLASPTITGSVSGGTITGGSA